MLSAMIRFKLFLWRFGIFSVPLIGYLKPKLIKLDAKQAIIKIALTRRSKNHLNSMYFGALASGADLAGGLQAIFFADQEKINLSLVFKTFHAEFLKRPEHDVFFICDDGEKIKAMVQETVKTGLRVTQPVSVRAVVNYPQAPEAVARFTLGLSIKVR